MSNTDSQIRIGEYIDIFFYRKWLFIVPLVLVLMISAMAIFFLPAVYRATVKIEVIASPLVSSYDLSTGVKQQFDSLKERVLSQSVLNKVVEKLERDNFDKVLDVQESIRNLHAKTIISMIGSQMIKVSYDGSDKEKTATIARILANTFIEESFKKREEEGNSAVDFIGSELEYYRDRIDQREGFTNGKDPMASRLQTKLRLLEDELAELLIGSREDHPMVIGLRREIADTRERFELAGVDIEMIDQSATDREVRLNEALYVELLSKLEMARISQRLKSEEERTKFRIIDLDRIMVYKVAPNTKKIVITGIVLGILMGIGFISLVEFIDHSFKGIEDIKGFLGLPTLGSIPEVNTD